MKSFVPSLHTSTFSSKGCVSFGDGFCAVPYLVSYLWQDYGEAKKMMEMCLCSHHLLALIFASFFWMFPDVGCITFLNISSYCFFLSFFERPMPRSKLTPTERTTLRTARDYPGDPPPTPRPHAHQPTQPIHLTPPPGE